jgi:GTP-binding protein
MRRPVAAAHSTTLHPTMTIPATQQVQRRARPLVAIVGRPNVGKSTLFNRVAGTRAAVVSDIAGTTRDRVTADTVWADRPFVLVDTGGLDLSSDGALSEEIRDQIDIAIDEADVIVMLTDVDAGSTAADRDVADRLRRSGRPVVLAANKADNEMRKAQAVDFYELGLGTPLPVSAYHNDGVDDLMAEIIKLFPATEDLAEIDVDLSIAIVGRANVGKSMLLNSLTGHQRAIVSDVPGTTRDALDTMVTFGDRSFLLIDTAGIRRSGSITPGIERYSVLRSIRAIDRADVAIVVLDSSELATAQDAHVGGYVLDAHKGIVLAVNKWDLADELDMTRSDAEAIVRARFRFVSHAPVRFVSALLGSAVTELIDASRTVHTEWTRTLPRYELRRTVMEAVARHPPATAGRRALKIYGVTQDAAGPPSFTFYVNRSNAVHFSYGRYLENAIRSKFGFEGSPLRMRFIGRGEGNPSARKGSAA